MSHWQTLAARLAEQLAESESPEAKRALIESLLSQVKALVPITVDKRLSLRECECLWWISKGYRQETIAVQMGIKRSTVKVYIRQIKRKLGCDTLAQAVFEGLRLGYFHTKPLLLLGERQGEEDVME